MGVVNATPDSFSDGGAWPDAASAVAHGHVLAAEGADVLDVGGESTRPGADPVDVDEELRRVVPVVEGLAAGTSARISVDTMKAQVARAAIAAGATYVNDVTAFRRDPSMAALVAESGAGCCLMHMGAGTDPRTMQRDVRYDDVVDDVKAFLLERVAFAVAEGVPESAITLDPGIGFAKSVEHNLELLRRVGEVVALGFPVVIGTSRKSFIDRVAGAPDPLARVPGTTASNVLAFERGARWFRVHDVAAARQALLVAAATLRGHGA